MRLVIVLEDGNTIISPHIVPDNPSHSPECMPVLKAIAREGTSMVKRLPEVKAWRFE